MLLLFLLLFLFQNSFGQNYTVPSYIWLGDKDLPTVRVSDTNLEDMTIAIAIDSQGNVYTLSFGNGVDKRDNNGNLIKSRFIASNQLNNPLDIAIDSQDHVYIADYDESGSCSTNGKVKEFNQQGQLVETHYTSFYRPIGIEFDLEDNLYVAEYNESGSGCESDELSRLRVYRTDGSIATNNSNVDQPFRVAVDSRKCLLESSGRRRESFDV